MSDDRTMTAKPLRPPQNNVPQSKQARNKLLEVIRTHVERTKPVPPLTIEELRSHTRAVLAEAGMEDKYSDFTAVLVNNEVWRETVAAIPYEKRLCCCPNVCETPRAVRHSSTRSACCANTAAAASSTISRSRPSSSATRSWSRKARRWSCP